MILRPGNFYQASGANATGVRGIPWRFARWERVAARSASFNPSGSINESVATRSPNCRRKKGPNFPSGICQRRRRAGLFAEPCCTQIGDEPPVSGACGEVDRFASQRLARARSRSQPPFSGRSCIFARMWWGDVPNLKSPVSGLPHAGVAELPGCSAGRTGPGVGKRIRSPGKLAGTMFRASAGTFRVAIDRTAAVGSPNSFSGKGCRDVGPRQTRRLGTNALGIPFSGTWLQTQHLADAKPGRNTVHLAAGGRFCVDGTSPAAGHWRVAAG